jgi:hypothetical protein
VSSPADPPRRPPPAVARRPVAYVEPDEPLWRQEVRDRLRSLTTAVTLVATVAIAALGIALWALFTGEQGGDGASAQRVRDLDRRVRALESLSQQGASREDFASVRDRQQALDDRVQALEERVEQPSEDVAAIRDALLAMQESTEELERRVDEVEQPQPLP